MYKTVYKYPLIISGINEIMMPENAEILTVQVQDETPCLWALVDIKETQKMRLFEVYGTGHPIYYEMGIERKYISTFQLHELGLVFHVFEFKN